MNDFLLSDDDDLQILNGDFVIGESLDQEVGLILRANKGDLKQHPLMGPNLIELLKMNVSEVELAQLIKKELKRDGKSYNDLKERIQLNEL